MKLKYTGFFFFVSTILTATTANANLLLDPYVGAVVGAGGQTVFIDDENHSESAQAYGAVIGLDVPILRAELEYNYMNNQGTKLNIGLFNIYAKMPAAMIHPYIGVGVGATFSSKFSNMKMEDSVAAYQGMLGITFDVPVLPIKVDAEARALYIPDIYTLENQKPDLLHYDLRVKLRYVF